ncbi:hypothetical protein [Actinacidiphila glaucinigra]|uniref:hypothetical protein n=1 Tax=Actinacidiphila glaucinigra TaxID=235986 RepID=UPI0035E2F5F0
MLIEGFEKAPVVAGEELLALPGFWAAYLLWLSQTEDYDPDLSYFDIDGADADAAYEALSDVDRWPAFRIPFAGGHTAIVLGVNIPDDPGMEYVITHPAWGRHGRLATLGGHQAGPGLSWRELHHIARTPDRDAPGEHNEHVRLLLLLPALGDQDIPEDAAKFVNEALAHVGITPTRGLSEALLTEHPLWEAAQWVPLAPSPLSGSRQPFRGILQCDDPMSPRCGIHLAQGITREQSDRLAHALGTWPAT